ncbi:leucine-rich repeat domain-containing protein [Flavivirga amylovorans]|uniref:Leucine-rich repeat domain-containing protein n=1 Tax=Flavivirga amylovorans TaxID=870486 RepID=A0ABT8X090_9FLAO|nr:leucine-rich repeat domain-containing protein [Flavivirga amylovorans]MDO5987356.1 leucine-rich repeat domain-containing protein [Flavivirga amylovorans]
MLLKTYLEYTDEKSSKFWTIEVDGNNYIVTYGKLNTKGQQITKNVDSNEKALKEAKKLINSKVKKGYVVVPSEEQAREEKGWFENLEDTVYSIYKNEILRYKEKDYRSIRLTRRGDYNRYALGLETKENGDYWEGINAAYDYEYEVFESFCWEVFGEKGIKNNWPSEDHYFDLDAFLTSIILGKVYLKLKQAPELKGYLKNISTVSIDFDDMHKLPFTEYFPDEVTRTVFVKKVAAQEVNQQLIFDLWADKVNGTGIDFLTELQIPLPQKKADSTIEQFKSVLDTSKDLWKEDKTKKAIKLLEPALHDFVTNSNAGQNSLIDEASGFLASYFKELKQIPEAVKAYQIGIAHVPNGYTALNLLYLLKESAFDNELMFSTAEALVKKGKFNNKEYRFYAYYYFGYACVVTEREEEAKKTFQTVKTFVDSLKDLNKLEEIIKDLSALVESETQEAEIAKEILPLFKGDIQETDEKQADKLIEWWASVPSNVKRTAMKYAKVKGDADQLAPSALLRVSRMDFLPLMKHELEEISFLTGFTHLETLYINRNQIADISVLSKCFYLKELYLSSNPITSIASLKNLYRLEKLEAGRCEIDNISVLSNLKRLEVLELNNNKVSDIESLNNLHALKELKLSNNTISDVSVIGTCTGLRKLDLENNPIEKGMEDIIKLPILQKIELDYSLIKEYLSDLPYLMKDWEHWKEHALEEEKKELKTWLKDAKTHPKFKEVWWKGEEPSVKELAKFVYTEDHISLENKKIGDLSLLYIFKRCYYLNVENTKISSLEGIENLSLLEYLIVSNNDIYNTSVVENFEYLRTLRASNCKLNNLSKLENCRNLKNLNVSDNNLKDLFPLDKLENLVNFSASKNKLRDIKPLANHKKLSRVTIENNEEALDLSPLASCGELRIIKCSSPRGITGLVALAKLPLLREVNTNGTASKIQIDMLRAKNPDLLIS